MRSSLRGIIILLLCSIVFFIGPGMLDLSILLSGKPHAPAYTAHILSDCEFNLGIGVVSAIFLWGCWRGRAHRTRRLAVDPRAGEDATTVAECAQAFGDGIGWALGCVWVCLAVRFFGPAIEPAASATLLYIAGGALGFAVLLGLGIGYLRRLRE